MNRPLWLKLIVVAVLALAILVPLGLIRGTISEREGYRQQAVASIAESYAGPQTLIGPMLIVPYHVDVETLRNDDRGVPRKTVETLRREWVFFPRDLRVDGQVVPDVRRRGLHEVRVYELRAALAAHFDATIPLRAEGGALRDIGTPYLSFGLSDVRGLVGTPRLRLGGVATKLLQGAAPARSGAGLHARLPVPEPGARQTLRIDLEFVSGGTEHLTIAPVGDGNRIALTSTWPHPQFAGRFLPRHEIGAKGFRAEWDISALAAGTQAQVLAARAQGSTDVAAQAYDSLTVSLVDPVDIYSQVDRASKYGLLFIALTFVGFFMFELLKRLPIHPVQYLLVGLALAIFFLLLLSLSEHIAFVWAYLIASAACIGLLGFYLAHVLRSRARGLGFAGALTLLYAVLYGLLVSEDNALVLGSVLLFGVLAAIMVLTRRIDWYAVGAVPAKAV